MVPPRYAPYVVETSSQGIATGIIDGFVYLGTAVQSLVYGGNELLSLKGLLPSKEAAKDPANWRSWPIAMVPVAIVGLVLATRVWNAKPKAAVAVPVAPSPDAGAAEDPALAATVAVTDAPDRK